MNVLTKKKIRTSQTWLILILAVVNAAIMGVLGLLSPTFFTYGNLSSVILRMSELNMLAIAETLIIIAGEMDISIGSIMALSGLIPAQFYMMGYPFWLGLVCGVAAGTAVGVVNGLLVIKLRLNSFIVSLATMTIVQSVVWGILRSDSLTDFPAWYLRIGEIYILGIPLLFIVMLVAAVLAVIFLRRTFVGRYLFAIGGNQRTAFVSGVQVDRVKFLVFVLVGFISSIAGLMFTIRIRAAIPDAGLNAPLQVITAVLIGGTLITGGRGSVLGSSLGILAMYLLTNGFSLLGVNPFWQQIVLGIILIYVVGRQGLHESVAGLFRRGKPRSAAADSTAEEG